MNITGEMLIGGSRLRGSGTSFTGFDPAAGVALEPAFHEAGAAEVERACALAEAAFDPYRNLDIETRAKFLEQIAEEILGLGDALIERACLESGLPRGRIEGERGRTVGQLRLFATVVRDGGWLEARIDPALPERKPLPRVDLRMRQIALGPVAVFGASNFPLAFSVAGGDTASALAAGCPVVVKAHPAHPGTSELVGRAIQAAVAACGLPEGVFSLLTGAGIEIGGLLVADPRIKAVGFTGSRRGGLALVSIAAKRAEPIPVYAEMSSINPVLLFPAALAARAEAIGQGFAGSLTLGAGQFCTNPGLVLAQSGPGLDAFIAAATAALKTSKGTTMLTAGIFKAFENGVSRLRDTAGVETLIEGEPGTGCNQGPPVLFATDAKQFLKTPSLGDEVFGASSLVIRCADAGEMAKVMEHVEGQLTVTLQIDEGDIEAARGLVPVLERKAGRLLVNAFPTGVEVSPAMVHGGPFPATSDSRSTSVGTLAIQRFLRPVCYQDFPAALLPDALRDENPTKIWRRVDGKMAAPAS
jgi:2,5-dioxopentanoate dehydrogenase